MSNANAATWITCKTPSQIRWVAGHGHVAATFLTGYAGTKRIFDVS